MPICLIITGQEMTSRARLYHQSHCRGPFRLVPTYRAIAVNSDTEDRYDFAVVRDSSTAVFEGLDDPYTTHGECPPSLPQKPYRAKPGTHWTKTSALRLYEDFDERRESLIGAGTTVRTHIMIHTGPGRSLGCMAIAGGKRGHRRLEDWLKRQGVAEDPSVEPIVVKVAPRYPDSALRG